MRAGTIAVMGILYLGLLPFRATAADDVWRQDGALPASERAVSALSDDRHRRFDFWIGVWDVNLRKRQPDFTWQDSVAARAHIYSILNGRAILELWDSTPIKGYSLRYFDPEKDKWILWLNWPSKNRTNASSLDGVFRHGRGDFLFTHTNAQGQEVKSRYSFNDISPDTLRWDDAFSADGGDSWRDHWRMEWTRVEQEPGWPIPSDTAPTYDDGNRCEGDDFRALEALTGAWRGELSGEGGPQVAHMRGYKILDGCAVMVFVRSAGEDWFFLNFFNTADKRWESHFLTSRRDQPMVRLFASESPFDLADEASGQRHVWRLDDNLTLTIRGSGAGGKRVLRLRKRPSTEE